MLKHQLIHPEINRVLGRAGHHAKILIADGNYPASTKKGPRARVVSMNLSPGVITCNEALEAILSAVPIEAINTMGIPPDDPYAKEGEPVVWNLYRDTIKKNGFSLELVPIEKWKFYEAVASDDHVLTIQTGEQALWANILLTIGCRQAEALSDS